MKGNGLVIAVFLLAALGGVLYWSSRHPHEESPRASAELPPKILALDESSISGLGIKAKGNDELTLVRNDAGKWTMTAPQRLPVDQTAMSSVISTLSSLTSERLVDDKATDLGQYGLAQPNLQVAVIEKDGKTRKLLIGDETPTGSSAFAALEGDPRIFTIPDFLKTSIDKTPNDLRDKRLLRFDLDKVSRAELLTPKNDIELSRNKDAWQILKPHPMRADGFQIQDFLRKLGDAKMERSALSAGANSAEAKATAGPFASGSPIATVRITDETGSQELQVRKNKNDFYAKSSVNEGIFKIPAEVGQSLSKDLDDFRNKKLFDFGLSDPNRIDLRDGDKTISLTRAGNDWILDGKKMDNSGMESFIGQVRDSTGRLVSGVRDQITVKLNDADAERLDQRHQPVRTGC